MSEERDPNADVENPWEVPVGHMVPTITAACPHCKATLGVPIQIQPVGVNQENQVVALESEEQIKALKGVLLVLASPVQTFICPRCSGQGAPEDDEPKRIITL